jgi:hypothetical protein
MYIFAPSRDVANCSGSEPLVSLSINCREVTSMTPMPSAALSDADAGGSGCPGGVMGLPLSAT